MLSEAAVKSSTHTYEHDRLGDGCYNQVTIVEPLKCVRVQAVNYAEAENDEDELNHKELEDVEEEEKYLSACLLELKELIIFKFVLLFI